MMSEIGLEKIRHSYHQFIKIFKNRNEQLMSKLKNIGTVRIFLYIVFIYAMFRFGYLNQKNNLLPLTIIFMFFGIIEQAIFDFKMKFTYKETIFQNPFRGSKLSSLFKILFLISLIGYYALPYFS